ncbi:MAG: hypothetical protein PHO29_12650 [Acetobacterium sp.]|nr:hypothetical protein [Acetobacterium sp.]
MKRSSKIFFGSIAVLILVICSLPVAVTAEELSDENKANENQKIFGFDSEIMQMENPESSNTNVDSMTEGTDKISVASSFYAKAISSGCW